MEETVKQIPAQKEEIEEPKDELAILIGEGKEYEIGGKTFIQKPLVLIDLKKIINPLSKILSAYRNSEEKLEDEGHISPNAFMRIALISEEAIENFNKILASILKQKEPGLMNAEEKEKFLVQHLKPVMISKIIADFFELNDIQEIIQNFTMISQKFNKKDGKVSK